MAITITSTADSPGKGASRPLFSASPRPVSVATFTIDFDTSYPTGGEAFDAEAQSEFRDVFLVLVQPAGGFVFEYVDSDTAASRKIKAYWGDYTNTSDGAFVEVADTTDISAASGTPVVVFGYK